MTRYLPVIATAIGLLCSDPTIAGASSFSVVNAAGADFSGLAIRRVGSSQWRPLGVSPPTGASAAVPFSDRDCAFDLRATTAGGETVIWSGVNLCDVKLVTLRRTAAGIAWVDYD